MKTYNTPHKEFFKFIYDRMVNVHKENPNVDYMISLAERINDLFGENSIEDRVYKAADSIIEKKETLERKSRDIFRSKDMETSEKIEKVTRNIVASDAYEESLNEMRRIFHEDPV